MKKKLHDALWNQIEEQKRRIKQLISKFYPDGIRAEFMKAPQIGKMMMESTAAQRFSEDKQTQSKCFKMIDDAEKKGATSIDIDFFCSTSIFQNLICADADACIMFKAAPEDVPVYMKQGFVKEGIVPRFLIDSKAKEAFLVLEDCNTRDRAADFMDRDSSFICLSEFYAIIAGDNDKTDDALCFMVSFSQTDGKCTVEKVDSYNMTLLDQLLSSNRSHDEPSTEIELDPQTESVTVTPEEKTSIEK